MNRCRQRCDRLLHLEEQKAWLTTPPQHVAGERMRRALGQHAAIAVVTTDDAQVPALISHAPERTPRTEEIDLDPGEPTITLSPNVGWLSTHRWRRPRCAIAASLAFIVLAALVLRFMVSEVIPGEITPVKRVLLTLPEVADADRLRGSDLPPATSETAQVRIINDRKARLHLIVIDATVERRIAPFENAGPIAAPVDEETNALHVRVQTAMTLEVPMYVGPGTPKSVGVLIIACNFEAGPLRLEQLLERIPDPVIARPFDDASLDADIQKHMTSISESGEVDAAWRRFLPSTP